MIENTIFKGQTSLDSQTMKDILHFKNEKIRHSNIFQNIIVIERCFLSVSNQDSLFVAKHGQNIIHEYAFYCQRVPLGNLVNQRIIWFFPVQWIYPDLNFSLDIFHPAYSLKLVALQLIRNSSIIFTPWEEKKNSKMSLNALKKKRNEYFMHHLILRPKWVI